MKEETDPPGQEDDGSDQGGKETGAAMTARVLHGSAFIMSSRIINAISLFIVSVSLARYLGIEQYGLIAIAMGVAGMLEVVGSLGMNMGSARYIPFYRAKGREDDVRRVVSINVTTKVSTAILLGALLYITAGFYQDLFDKPVEPLMQIAAIVLALNILGGAFYGILRGLQRMLVMAAANVIRDAVWMVTSLALVLVADLGPEGALWGFVAGALVWVVISFVAMVLALREDLKDRRHLEDRYDRTVVWAMVTFGFPVLLSKLLFMVFDWTGTYMLAYYGTVEDVSIYNVAFGIVTIPLVLIKAISTALMPALSQAYGEGRMGLMRTLWSGSLKLINAIFIPLAAMLMVLAGPAILLIYGEDYVPGATAVLILAPYLLVRPTGLQANHLLAAMARQNLIFKVNMVAVVLNLVLALVLVPAMGIEGAAIAVTISFYVNSLLLYHYARREAGVDADAPTINRLLVGAIISMVVSAGVFLLTGPLGLDLLFLLARLAAAFLSGLGVYLLYVRRVRIFTEDEMENVVAVSKHSRLAGMILKLLGQ